MFWDKSILIYLTALFILQYGCIEKQPENTNKSKNIQYAKGFTIYKKKDYKIIEVHNPWQKSGNITYRYILTDSAIDKKEIETEYNHIIRTPVQKVVCFSTTHISMIDNLNELESIKGITNADLITNKCLRKRYDSGKVADIGHSESLHYEKIIQLDPDVIFAYTVEGKNIRHLKKLEDMGFKIIMNAEYLENTPLGRAEWIKCLAAFFDKENIADSIFSDIENKYNRLVEKASISKEKPVIMTSLPWKGVWYMPGGDSYFSNFIQDAGGKYLWEKNQLKRSFAVNFEDILVKSSAADIWVNCGTADNLKDILKKDERLKHFKPYQTGKVYNNNKKINKQGGNDFWESGIINPHIILRDLINIFHPGLLDSDSLHYYQKLE